MPEISDEELQKYKDAEERATSLEASKRRLEEESGKYKTRAQEAEGKLSEAEKDALKAKGDERALREKAEAELDEVRGKYKTRTSDVLKEKLRTEILKHAKDAHDVDMVLRVADHKDLLKLDEESLTVEGTKEFVEKCRETHKYLFSSKRLDAGDNRPPAGDEGEGEAKTEEQKYQAELRACTTRQQMTDVRKKYGKPVD